MITIVGLGAEDGDLTEKGRAAILAAERVILRTDRTLPAQNVVRLGIPYESLDGKFSRVRTYAALYERQASYVIAEAKGRDLVYCVDGSGLEDRSVQIVMKRRKKTALIPGISKATYALRSARMPETTCDSVSAYDLAERGRLCLPAVIYDIDDALVAGDVKLALGDRIGEETEIFFVRAGQAKKISVYDLDRQAEYDESCAAVIREIPLLQKTRFDVDDVRDIVIRLRKPDGCPWDKVQTPESIRMDMVEEAYELVDAIDSGDADKICEETGDVLLQAVFHAVMQEERGAFNLTDAVSGLCNKLISRHTHIFGQDVATDESSALSVWEKNKEKEKGQDTFSKAVNDVPACFPACMRAQKTQKRAGKSGLDFSNVAEAEQKVYEELGEWESAVAEGKKERIQEELGDLLFSVVNIGRLSGVDCELALKESVQKFARRFTETETLVLADGKRMENLSPEELDTYYRRAKAGDDETSSH